MHAPAPSLAALMAPSRAIPSPAPSPLNTPSPTSVPSPAPTSVPSPAPHELRMPASTTTTEARTPCGSFEALSRRDFPRCELLVVLGTSLAVQPFAGKTRGLRLANTRTTRPHTCTVRSLLLLSLFAGLVGRVGRHTPRLLVNRERVGERGTAGGRGLGRPFDFEKAHAHSNDVLYQGDCDAGVRELAAALGWQHELERLCSGGGGNLCHRECS